MTPFIAPPRKVLPIVHALVEAYKLWQDFLPHFAKVKRYSIGAKIDTYFLETIESAVVAASLAKEEKLPWIKRGIAKLDLLKFFLYLAWETKSFDTKKYAALSERLDEIGRMLGGWKKQQLSQ